MARLLLVIVLNVILMSGCSSILSHSRDGHENDEYVQRTLGTALDDSTITGKIESKIRAANEHYASMIFVDVYNKIVLLTGRVPDKEFIKKAITIASHVTGVRQVHSEISRGKPTTISNYWYDTWLTAKVKSKMVITDNVPAGKVNIRSFAGNVYLMGVMTESEARKTTYVARRVPGAKKVISLIETLPADGSKPFISKKADYKNSASVRSQSPAPQQDKPLNSTPKQSRPEQTSPKSNQNLPTKPNKEHNTKRNTPQPESNPSQPRQPPQQKEPGSVDQFNSQYQPANKFQPIPVGPE